MRRQFICFLLALNIQDYHFKAVHVDSHTDVVTLIEGCKDGFFQYNGCDYDQLIAHPTNCNKFLQCSNGYEYILFCPKSLVFNVEKQQCDYFHNVARCRNPNPTTSTTATERTTTMTTSTTSVSTTGYKYPCSPGELYPNPEDPSSYIECRLQVCPKGMTFDVERSQCIFPGCKKLREDEIRICGSFDGGQFPRLSSKKMSSADSCHDYKQCVKYSKNPLDVDLCVFSCDNQGEDNPALSLNYRLVFVEETQSCEVPSYIDFPCGGK